MSDPVSNVEIEDVLSSIRRLVSEEVKTPQPQKKSEAAPMGRLVLTPALRVATPEPVEKNQPEEPSAEELATLQELARRAWGDGAWPKTAEDNEGALELADGPAEEAMDVPADELAAETLVEAVVESAAEAEPEAMTPTLESTIAELEAAIGKTDEDWEPNGDEEPKPDYRAWKDTVEPETAEPETAKAPEPAMPLQDALDAADALDNDIDGFDDIEADEDDVAMAGLGLDEDDALIDEDMLRDLVSEIVRQELQGALGERITRNVRKLVRREIQRALSVKDFE